VQAGEAMLAALFHNKQCLQHCACVGRRFAVLRLLLRAVSFEDVCTHCPDITAPHALPG
jgi:hypothetical protein